jgi:hypothetical protein
MKMPKAVLVMDMPECCADCQLADDDPSGLYCMFADDYYDGSDSSEDRASFCPLRELPERSDHPEHCDNGRFDAGWNACLNTIEGGVHEQEQSE